MMYVNGITSITLQIISTNIDSGKYQLIQRNTHSLSINLFACYTYFLKLLIHFQFSRKLKLWYVTYCWDYNGYID